MFFFLFSPKLSNPIVAIKLKLSFIHFNLQDAMEYAECEAMVKDFPPFREAMKKRGIDDMDLVMVDAW